MADKRIDDFTQISSLSDGDVALVSSGGVTLKATMSQIRDVVTRNVVIQSGVFSGTTGQYGAVTITYDRPFSAAPVVCATMMREYKYQLKYSTRNTTTLGFQVYNYSNNSAAENVTVEFCWIAIGPVSS